MNVQCYSDDTGWHIIERKGNSESVWFEFQSTDIREYLAWIEEKTKNINGTLGTVVWPRDNKIAGLSGSEIQSAVSVVRKATLVENWSPKDGQPAERWLASSTHSKHWTWTVFGHQARDLINLILYYKSNTYTSFATWCQLVINVTGCQIICLFSEMQRIWHIIEWEGIRGKQARVSEQKIFRGKQARVSEQKIFAYLKELMLH